jgi:hypothetical protein
MWELMKAAVVTFLDPDGAPPPARSSGHPDAAAEVKIIQNVAFQIAHCPAAILIFSHR